MTALSPDKQHYVIIASTYGVAKELATQLNIDLSSWKFVSRLYELRGLSYPKTRIIVEAGWNSGYWKLDERRKREHQFMKFMESWEARWPGTLREEDLDELIREIE